MSSKPAKDTKNEKASKDITIESRFGSVTVDTERAIFFPHGLLGLPDNLHFAITDIPKDNMKGFSLLQCLNDHSLSFVVMPIDLDNNLIEKKDLEEVCNAVGVPAKNLLTLLIVSVQRSPESVKVTANLRAPVIVDAERKIAGQYVFPHNKYEICHQLG